MAEENDGATGRCTTSLPPILERGLSRYELFARALMERPESLSRFLPYDEYLPDFGLMRLKDGSLGVVYEVTLCEHETKTGEQVVRLLVDLRAWFRLPDDLVLSLLFEQSRISPHDRSWNSHVTDADQARGDLPSRLHLATLDRLRADPPMRRRLFLSIRNFPRRPGRADRFRTTWQELGAPYRTLGNEAEAFIRQARGFNHSLSQFELTSPLPLRRLSGEDLADYLRRTFNPVTYYKRPFAPVNPRLPLSEQVIYCPSQLDYPGIEREGIRTRTVTLKNAPSFAYPGAMAYFLGLDFPFRLALNVSFPSAASVKRHFGLKDFFLQNTPSARSRRQKEEVQTLQDRLVRDDRVLHLTFSALLEAESSAELDAQTQECLARFQQRLECEAIVEQEIGLGLWFNALPLAYHPIADYTTKRAIRILASDITHFCPVFDSFRGTSEAQSLFLSREGGLVPFSLKTHGNSHHVAVLGDTGSAKSGQVIRLLLGELRREPRPLIFVIDFKTSYGMVSRFVPSELTTFEQGKPMPFSPFRGELDEDKLRFLVQLLTSAMQLTSHEFHLDSEHRTCLTQAIRLAFEAKARSAGVRYEAGALVEKDGHASGCVTLDDVIAQLGSLTGLPEFERYGQFVEEITKKLRPFYADGIYAPFFRQDSGAAASSNADLYVFDLDGLAGDPVLQALVTMSVVDEIRRRIKTPDARARGGFIVVEELGMLGRSNPVAKDFVIDAAETFRKLGFFLIGLTPNPRNYFDMAAGQAMWAVADHYLLLAMKEDNVDFIAKNSNLLDEATAQIAKSLRTVRGSHADVLYVHKSKASAGAFRSRPSSYELWLMPTHLPDAVEAQNALDRFPGEPVRALEDLVARYPAGTKDVPSEGSS
jgi:hypothetical protein